MRIATAKLEIPDKPAWVCSYLKRTFAPKFKPMYRNLSIFLFLLLASCGGQATLDTLTEETITIHDEAMANLANMNRVKRELKAQYGDSTQVIQDVLLQIKKADTDMMAWMANYKAPEDMPVEDAITYMEAQKASISQNRDDIQAAIDAGKKLLKNE